MAYKWWLLYKLLTSTGSPSSKYTRAPVLRPKAFKKNPSCTIQAQNLPETSLHRGQLQAPKKEMMHLPSWHPFVQVWNVRFQGGQTKIKSYTSSKESIFSIYRCFWFHEFQSPETLWCRAKNLHRFFWLFLVSNFPTFGRINPLEIQWNCHKPELSYPTPPLRYQRYDLSHVSHILPSLALLKKKKSGPFFLDPGWNLFFINRTSCYQKVEVNCPGSIGSQRAWDNLVPAIHNDSVESKTPLRQLRSRGNEFHIGTLFLFSSWLDEMLHGVIPYESSNCFSVYTPFSRRWWNNRWWWWKEAETKKGGAKSRLAKVPSLTKIQSMDSLQSGSFETYLNYIDDTVSHIRSQTFRQMLPDFL